MDSLLPVLITASIFLAILLLDFIKKLYSYTLLHTCMGIVSVLIMMYIGTTIGPGAAWALLLAPFLFVFLGLLLEQYTSRRHDETSEMHHRVPMLGSSLTSAYAPTLSPSASKKSSSCETCDYTPTCCCKKCNPTPSATCGGPASSSSSGCLNPATVHSA
jgi:hypothetical protein